MTKIILKSIISLLVPLFAMLFPNNSWVEFHSIDYPKEVIITEEFNKTNLLLVKINYKYFGNDIVSNDGEYGKYTFSKMNFIKGNISYIDEYGEILPGAGKYFEKIGFNEIQRHEGGASSHGLYTLFQNERINSVEMAIFSSSIYENTDIGVAIEKESLSAININIEEIKICWDFIDYYTTKRRTRKGEFTLKVNKTIRIKVKYNDGKYIKPETGRKK